MTHTYRLRALLLALSALILCACRTQSHTGTSSGSPAAGTEELSANFAKGIWNKRVETKSLTASLSVSLNIGGREVNCDGKLRMKRDDVLQLSLSLPLIGTEVGRLECTPDEVLLIDRINRQYMRAAYKDVDFLAQAGLDFYALQAIFWNELFIPGKASPRDDFARFRLSKSGDHALLSLTDMPRLEYDFLTRNDNDKISRLNVRSHNVADAHEFVCVYENFAKAPGGGLFPTKMRLSFNGTGRTMQLGLDLSRLSADSKWDTRTTLSAKYRQRKPEELLRQLGSIL
ncbi:MAG: DUF4292 domain-containing protein [Alloprevotella sp.]|nr:DUF4292 domain-containing protein [Alloprevotella sp.]